MKTPLAALRPTIAPLARTPSSLLLRTTYFFALWFVVCAAAACGGDSNVIECTEGETDPCICDTLTLGFQTCGSDGTYGACDCSGVTPNATSNNGTSGNNSAGGDVVLGDEADDDSACSSAGATPGWLGLAFGALLLRRRQRPRVTTEV
jgi:MYXO-CTERM domain-containing protein